MGSLVDLLRRAREAGLRVEHHAGKLRIRGPRDAELLVESLRAHKAEILALLALEELPSVRRREPAGSGQEGGRQFGRGGHGIVPGAGSESPGGNPGHAARQAWEAALTEMGDRWEAHAATAEAAGREPAWIEDKELQAAIRQSILRSDLAGTLNAITAWSTGSSSPVPTR